MNVDNVNDMIAALMSLRDQGHGDTPVRLQLVVLDLTMSLPIGISASDEDEKPVVWIWERE